MLPFEPVTQKPKRSILTNNNLATFFAAFAGVALALPVSLAIAMPMFHDEVATQTRDLGKQIVKTMPSANFVVSPDNMSNLSAADFTPEELAAICGVPAAGRGAGLPVARAVVPSRISVPGPQVGRGAEAPSKNVFVKKLVTGGMIVKDTGIIKNTGPDSFNKIEFKNSNETNIENNNNITAVNNNEQSAESGKAETEHNTTAGRAASGDAANSSDTDFSLNVRN